MIGISIGEDLFEDCLSFEHMDELLDHFKTASLPTRPIKINNSATVTGLGSIESCKSRYAKGNEQSLLFLLQYKDAIEALGQPEVPLLVIGG